ncbi:hypothetical protein KM043_017691 [Ampulex compressa]|nr:hypothetical protein KM043_017691 [Ampulex compressa]
MLLLSLVSSVLLACQSLTSAEITAEELALSRFEKSVALKLKVATRLKRNLGKVLHLLPRENYELYVSTKILQDYLRNGNSLLKCLDILPSLAYAPMDEQIDGILATMEDQLPKYLIPAISTIRRSVSRKDGILDVDEVYRPDFGPVKADMFEKIKVRELKEAALPIPRYGKRRSIEGPWPEIIGEIAALMARGKVSPRGEVIGYILANLRIPDATPEAREAVERLVDELRNVQIIKGIELSSDPYQLVKNVMMGMNFKDENLVAAEVIVPHLRRPKECEKTSELGDFFQNNRLNHTLLIYRDEKLARSRIGDEFVKLIDTLDLRRIMEKFNPFEHTSWRHLLLAFVGTIRRHQAQENALSDVVDSVYGDLFLRTPRKEWDLFRNPTITQTVLSAMSMNEESGRIKRLLIDIGNDRSIVIKEWRRGLAYGSLEYVTGPVDAALKTIDSLRESAVASQETLKENIIEVLYNYRNKTQNDRSNCITALQSLLPKFEKVGLKNESDIKDVDFEDLLQAVPDMDADDYKVLEKYLAETNLEEKFGKKPNLEEHPTRGRLLSWLLLKMENLDSVEQNIRRLASKFADRVSFEGYGASRVSLRFS